VCVCTALCTVVVDNIAQNRLIIFPLTLIQFSCVRLGIIHDNINFFLSTFFPQFVFLRICSSTFPVNHNGLSLVCVTDFLGINFSMASCITPLNVFHILLVDSVFELISDIRSRTNSRITL